MWPFKKKPVDIPPCPSDIVGIRAYHDETSAMIDANEANIGRLFSREFARNGRIIDARQEATNKAIDALMVETAQAIQDTIAEIEGRPDEA